MIPLQIVSLINQLIKKTENNELTWVYDDENSTVFLDLRESGLSVTLKYRFDETYEVGRFFINLNLNKIDYFFDAKEDDSENYLLLKNLYDLAQACKFSQEFTGLII